jgi:hypothetical protein
VVVLSIWGKQKLLESVKINCGLVWFRLHDSTSFVLVAWPQSGRSIRVEFVLTVRICCTSLIGWVDSILVTIFTGQDLIVGVKITDSKLDSKCFTCKISNFLQHVKDLSDIDWSSIMVLTTLDSQ